MLKIEVDVRLPYLPAVRRLTVLDDTGSSHLELFSEDCLALGFHPLHVPPAISNGMVKMMTANGPVQLECIDVEVQFVALDGTAIGDVTHVTAVVLDVPVGTRARCSGQGLRGTLCTATAPLDRGHGALIVGTNKSRVVTCLPARPAAP